MYTDNSSFEKEYAPFIEEFFANFKIGSNLHSCGC